MLNYAWHHLAMRCIAFVTNIGHTHQVNRVHDVVFSIGWGLVRLVLCMGSKVLAGNHAAELVASTVRALSPTGAGSAD